jgi:uncharacterized protein (DUF2141 family)
MQNKIINLLFIVIIALVLVNCANRGSPTGGPKDVTPPQIIKTTPENYTTNFKGDEIIIYFDEYIKLKELSKQLIISPPMKRIPDITPLGGANKYIRIKIYDTLQPNTTYAFNFGNSIVDNNEENPFKYYRYVFSTGNYIDSLTVKGSVKDALEYATDTFISVVLYEADSTYTDSIVYKETPKYVTNTLDSTTNFTIENIKAGKYYLRAIKDENSDNKFQQRIDKIGFYETPIEVKQDSSETSYDLKLFKEVADYKASKPYLIAGEKIAFGFQGDYETMKIKVISKVPDNYKSRYFKDAKTDTLNYFYSPKLEVDSLLFKITNRTAIDTFKVRIKDNLKDSLNIKPYPTGSIRFDEQFSIQGNIPFTKLDESKISIIDRDSTAIKYTTSYDSLSNKYSFDFDKVEENRYKIQMLPEAVTDFFENKNDTLNFSISTITKNNFGNARIELSNVVYPVIVELTDDKGKVKFSSYLTELKPVDFADIKPSKYYLRVIYDTNKNGVYDSGNYLKGRQPERVSYMKEPYEAKAGFDEIIKFKLLN